MKVDCIIFMNEYGEELSSKTKVFASIGSKDLNGRLRK